MQISACSLLLLTNSTLGARHSYSNLLRCPRWKLVAVQLRAWALSACLPTQPWCKVLTWADLVLGRSGWAMPAKPCQISLGQYLWMCFSQSLGAVWPWQAGPPSTSAKTRAAACVSVTWPVCSMKMSAVQKGTNGPITGTSDSQGEQLSDWFRAGITGMQKVWAQIQLHFMSTSTLWWYEYTVSAKFCCPKQNSLLWTWTDFFLVNFPYCSIHSQAMNYRYTYTTNAI